MADFDTQINVGMNVDGVVTGTEKAKRSLKELGSSARESGKSVEGMGDGGAKAADKIESATRSMVNSIQRQTAALEAGDKSSRKYQESLAKMRGVDANALKPYLDQLDAAKAKAAQAATASESLSSSFGKIQTVALVAAAAIGTFVAAFKKINDGVDALNDLKDATGASIENISGLEDVALRTGASFDTVSTSLIKLNQGLNSAKPGSETENAIKAIGLSVKDLKALDPAEAFRQIAVSLSGFADDGNKARLTQELFGKSLKEVAPLLKDLAESGQLNAKVTTAQAEEAEKFNKQLFNLQKNSTDAGRALVADLLPALNAGIERFILARKHAGGLLETLALYGRLDYGKNIQGNLGEVEKQIAQLEERATRITSAGAKRGNDKMIADLKAQAAYLKELGQMKILAEQGDNGDAVSRRYNKDKPSVNLPDQSAAKEAAAAAKRALAEQNKEIAEQNKLIAENAGLTGTFAKDWANLTAIYNKGGFSLDQYTEAQAKLLANQPAIKANTEAEAKANLAALDARQKYVASLGAGLDKLQQETASQQEYIDRLGLSKEAVADLDAAKLESQATIQDLIVLKKIEQGLDEEQYDIYVKTAAELRKQAALKRTGASKESEIEAAVESAKAANDEWKRGWEETDRISRDVFTAWATEGGSAAKIIGDTLKKALLSAIYEATLKPLVFQVYASLTGGGGASAALQAASGVGSTASGIGNLFGIGGAGGYASQFASGYSGSASAASAMMGGAELTTAAQMGSMAAAVAPYLLGAIALKALTDYKVTPTGSGITATLGSGGVASGSVSSYRQFEQQGGLFGGGTTTNRDWSMADAGTTQYINEATKAGTAAIKAYAAAIGLSSTSIDSFTKSIDVSLAGLDPEQAKAAINKAIGGFFDDMVSSAYADIASLSKPGEAASATLQRVATDFVAVTHSLDMLGFAALKAGADSAKAAASIIDSFGGLDKFNASVGYFYEHFFSEGERAAKNQESTKAEFAKLNLDMPTSKEAYRKLVEDTIKATDANSESSRKFLADLLSLAPAFDSVANSAANAATAATAAAAAHQQAVNAALANYGTPEEQKANALKQIQAGLASGGVNLSIEQISKASRADARALWEQYMALAAQGNKDAQAAADAILAQQDAFAKITDAYNQGGMTGGATGGTDPGGDRGVWGTNASITYDYADSVPGGSGGATSASKAWKEATDAIKATMADLRKTLIENGPDSFARIQAQFAIELAQARAGDAKAAKDLPDLAKQMIAAQKGNSASALDEALFKARLVEQLGSVVGEDPATEAAKAALRAARDAANVAALAAEELINAAIDRANSLAETKAGEVSGGRLTHLYDGPVKYWRDYQTDSPFGIPSYDVGTNYVPKDMIAQIHKGEAIVPVAYNPMANGNAMGGNGYTELVAEVRALRAEVAAQRPALDATASNTGKAAKVLDAAASGGQPLGMEIV